MENSEAKKVPLQYAGAYRNFVSGKYTKYKEQKAGLTDKEILDTIINEWQSLDEETKKGLKSEYVDNNINSKSKNKSTTKDKSEISWLEEDARSLSSYDDAELRDDMDSNELNKNEKDTKKEKVNEKRGLSQSKKKTNPKKVGEEEGLKNKEEERRPTIWEEDSEVMHESNFIIDEDPKKKGNKIKAKKITKKVLSQAQNEYLNFSKFHYQKLKMEHPEWSMKQLRNIVKLLWKKRKQSISTQPEKPTIKKDASEEKEIVKMSGKNVYKNCKSKEGSNEKEILENWEKLPFESKKYWERKGKGSKEAMNKRTGYNLRFMRKHEKETPANKVRGPEWMNKTMK